MRVVLRGGRARVDVFEEEEGLDPGLLHVACVPLDDADARRSRYHHHALVRIEGIPYQQEVRRVAPFRWADVCGAQGVGLLGAGLQADPEQAFLVLNVPQIQIPVQCDGQQLRGFARVHRDADDGPVRD